MHVLLLGIVGFLTLGSYAIARPAIDSLYIATFTADYLPHAWLGVGIVATITVLIYGRLTASLELTQVLRGVLYVSYLILLGLLCWHRTGEKAAVFCLYIWKDIYIVMLIEMFWSIANSMFQLKTAKWVYGLFCVVGSLGGVTANLAIGPIAKSIGTANAPWLVLPILLMCACVALLLPSIASPTKDPKMKVDFLVGLRVVRQSRYLGLLLAVIALTQIAITLIDFEFNRVLESAYPDPDERTAMIGKVYAAIDVVSLTLQLGRRGHLYFGCRWDTSRNSGDSCGMSWRVHRCPRPYSWRLQKSAVRHLITRFSGRLKNCFISRSTMPKRPKVKQWSTC